eukprot:763683-Hanusia_phi.AAC.3
MSGIADHAPHHQRRNRYHHPHRPRHSPEPLPAAGPRAYIGLSRATGRAVGAGRLQESARTLRIMPAARGSAIRPGPTPPPGAFARGPGRTAARHVLH